MKLKKLSSLVALAIAAGTLSGCFYDEPNSVIEPPECTDDCDITDPGTDPIEGVDYTVLNGSELNDVLTNAKAGEVIGLSVDGDFNTIGMITLDKPITLVSVNSEGEIAQLASSQAVISGASCISIPDSADEILKGTSGVRISNIKFENVAIEECGTDSTSKSIINVGKVGNGETPVQLDNLTFDGSDFVEDMNSSSAWVYSRGLLTLDNNEFLNKQVDNLDSGILFLNCGSNRASGGSSYPTGSSISNSTFSLERYDSQSTAKAATIGLPGDLGKEDRNCSAQFTKNTFENFQNLVSVEDAPSTALYDVFDDTQLIDNTLVEVGEPGPEPEPTEPVTTVDEANSAIAAAAEGDIITLSAEGTFNEGVITLNKAVIIEGEDAATITGSACILVSAGGATVRNLTFNNDSIGFDVNRDDNNCVLSGSTGRSGAIAVTKAATETVNLENLTIDAQNIDKDTGLNNKSSWIYAEGKVSLTESTFNNIPSSFLNMAFYSACNEDKSGSVIKNNQFHLDGTSGSESAAIRLGNSSSNIVEANDCNFTIESNEFHGAYKTLNTDEMSSDVRPLAIHAVRESIVNSNFETTNNLVNP